jgi:hypothetical protein
MIGLFSFEQAKDFTTSVRVVDACFAQAGGSAVYDRSPLQRRLRDIHVAAQYAGVHPRNYIAAGKAGLARFNCRFQYRHANHISGYNAGSQVQTFAE